MQHPLQLELKEQLISSDNEVLQKLKKIYERNTDNFNLVITQMSKIEDLNRRRIKDIVTPAEDKQERSKIQDAIFYLIDAITEEEAAAYELENAVFKRFLVICKNQERAAYMKGLFPERVFKETVIDGSGAPLPAEEVNKYDLVIFDNNPDEGKDGENALIRYYLDNTESYLLYLGAHLNLLLNYPEKAYFSNSIFSLHARIEEMMTYLKYKHAAQ